jgi:hypothetical protein
MRFESLIILLIIVGFVLCMVLIPMSEKHEAAELAVENGVFDKRLVVIDKYITEGEMTFYTFINPATGVLYVGTRYGGVQELHNPDGSPFVYEGDFEVLKSSR